MLPQGPFTHHQLSFMAYLSATDFFLPVSPHFYLCLTAASFMLVEEQAKAFYADPSRLCTRWRCRFLRSICFLSGTADQTYLLRRLTVTLSHRQSSSQASFDKYFSVRLLKDSGLCLRGAIS